jgi:hypothetical protein
MAASNEERTISQGDLDSFTGRLEEWGHGLPENEQTLLRVVLAQAKGGAGLQVDGFSVGPEFGLTASAVLGPAIAGGLTASADDDSAWHEWIRDWDRYSDVGEVERVDQIERNENG